MDRQTTTEFPSETKPLAYSYWLGTFAIRGSVAPRIILDVFGFGLLALATVFASQFATKHFDISLTIPAGPFEVAGAVLGLLLVLRLLGAYCRRSRIASRRATAYLR